MTSCAKGIETSICRARGSVLTAILNDVEYKGSKQHQSRHDCREIDATDSFINSSNVDEYI